MCLFKPLFFLCLFLPIFCLGQMKKEYWEDGQIKYTGRIKNGRKEGRHKQYLSKQYWPKKKRLWKLSTYKNDTLHGKYIVKSGVRNTVVARGKYKNGFKHGWFRYYNLKGVIEKKILFDKGQRVTEVENTANGLRIISHFQNDSLVRKDSILKRNQSLPARRFDFWAYGVGRMNCMFLDPEMQRRITPYNKLDRVEKDEPNTGHNRL